MFPYGVMIAAASISRRRREKEKQDNKRLAKEILSSSFSISVDIETIELKYNVKKDFDWARAAWALSELPTAYAQCAKKRGLRSEDLSFPIYEESSLQDGCNHPNLTNRIGDPRRPVRFLFFRRVPAVYAQGAGCSSILHASFRMFFAA